MPRGRLNNIPAVRSAKLLGSIEEVLFFLEMIGRSIGITSNYMVYGLISKVIQYNQDTLVIITISITIVITVFAHNSLLYIVQDNAIYFDIGFIHLIDSIDQLSFY